MKVYVVLALALLAGPAIAQHHGHGHGRSHDQQGQGADTPYAGMQQRAIKALNEEQIADIKAGRGMGLALAAELNGYPGPMHVLELGERLRLTGEQRQRFQGQFEAMKAEAIAAGEVLLAREQALDEAFARGSITPEALAALTHEVGVTQAHLRAVHLKYHLTAADLLTAEQKRRYAELRGYR
jgi:Spy/CpxP family protein refolding chaperone